jgi:hypothetical protein
LEAGRDPSLMKLSLTQGAFSATVTRLQGSR